MRIARVRGSCGWPRLPRHVAAPRTRGGVTAHARSRGFSRRARRQHVDTGRVTVTRIGHADGPPEGRIAAVGDERGVMLGIGIVRAIDAEGLEIETPVDVARVTSVAIGRERCEDGTGGAA